MAWGLCIGVRKNNMTFNEDSRVKLPSILHLTRLEYKYISLKNDVWDESTNIFPDIFTESILKINNNDVEIDEVNRLLEDISLLLDNEDLGKAFYESFVSHQKGVYPKSKIVKEFYDLAKPIHKKDKKNYYKPNN